MNFNGKAYTSPMATDEIINNQINKKIIKFILN